MSKIRYKYNTKTLSYEKAVTPIVTRIFRVISFLFTASVIGAVSVVISFRYFDSPKEKQMRRELETAKLQYDLLNRKVDQMNLVMQDLSGRDNNIYRAILETDSIPDALRKAGFGTVDRYKSLEGFEYSTMMVSLTQKVDRLEKEMYIQSKSYDEVIKLAKGKENMLACIPCIMPISNKDLKHAPGGFGWRIHPIYKTPEFHPGMDFAAPQGTEIFATANGTVTVADDKSQGYGNHVVIDHGYGYETLYGHMVRFIVVPGQKVKRGQVIGYVGTTGLSTAPHCHYEVHKNGELMNPVNYYMEDLTPEQYALIIKLSSETSQTFD
ncbi:MAG: M23 family metallopeptidase [Bacteroidetes bacterium]|nr:M23 family metallopeptidase [Bacteroidota bacterium]